MKYPLIKLNGKNLGSHPDYIKDEIRRATKQNAPRHCYAASESGKIYLCSPRRFRQLKYYNGGGIYVPQEDMDEVEALMDALPTEALRITTY